MRTLQRTLNELFSGPKPRRVDHAAKDRAAFKRLAAKTGLTFAKARDGYLEAGATAAFPAGVAFAHHGWDESLSRLQAVIDNPSVLDADGYYSE